MICPYLVTLPEGGAFGSAMSRVFPERVYEGLSRSVRELDWHEARRDFMNGGAILGHGSEGIVLSRAA